MVGFGAFTAPAAGEGRCPARCGRSSLALERRGAVTLGLVLALGVFEAEPRYLVPVGGMVIGNSMTAAAVALNRLADEVRGQARPDRGDAGAGRHLAPGGRAGWSPGACARG